MIGTFQGRVALVTGGAVRLGAAICRALAHEGATVVIHYRSSTQAAEHLRDEIERAFTIKANLNSEAACAHLVDETIKAAGGLDILVNSAAVFEKETLRETSMEKLMDQFWPNLFAPLQLIRAFAAKRTSGKIVNILDRRIAGHDASCVPYLLSKKALAELTQLAALELAPGFTVNAVAPGPILPPPGKGEEYLKDNAGRIPLGVQPTPQDIAKAVVYLLKSNVVTGQVIYVDGGQHLLGNGV